ncbi:MAG: adenosine deaminase family protein [Acidobacteriaceae bacterium]
MPRICRIPKRLVQALRSSVRLRLVLASLLLLSTLAPIPVSLLAQPATPGEQRAVRAFEAARASKANALALDAFLAKMPKGADLHMHLSGAVYAETFLKEAAADNLCVDPTALGLVKYAAITSYDPVGPICPPGDVPAANVFQNQKLYDALVDAFSMRSFVPSASSSGHDHFFAAFDRFNALDNSHAGQWLDEVATRAAAQNEQYLEVMLTPSFFDLAPLWNSLGWPATPASATPDTEGDTAGTSHAELDTLRTKLLAGGMHTEVALDVKEMDDALAQRNRIEHCGQPDAAPACAVKIRYIYQVLRAFPPQQVFAQTLLAFEVASADPNVVGLNFVQPEDAMLAMSEYSRQMHMLDYLHSVYPKVHISLHAGELAPGLVPPEGLRFHIREAVELGHAERIGHGVDVMFENDPRALLREMADRHVMVEINLTSNEVILGIVPPHHPLPEYRAAHVPVALSTDDEGVSRIDLTHEYVRAAMEYGLGYLDLKAMARTSLEHSFLPGESLWQRPDDFTHVKAACAGQTLGAASPTAKCQALLGSSEKATQQWELERRFAAFEASLP